MLQLMQEEESLHVCIHIHTWQPESNNTFRTGMQMELTGRKNVDTENIERVENPPTNTSAYFLHASLHGTPSERHFALYVACGGQLRHLQYSMVYSYCDENTV